MTGAGFFGFGLQGFEPQDLTVLVALVQSFELVDERGGTVSPEALIPGGRKTVTLHQLAYLLQKKNCNQHLMSNYIPETTSQGCY